MYQYTFSEEDTQKLKNESQKNSLLKSFSDVDKKYSSTSNTSAPNLERLTHTSLSDNEIKKQAEDSLYEYKTTGQSDIESQYNSKANLIDEQIKEKNLTGDIEKQELQSLYSSLKQNASNDAIKRGLARSSIIVTTLEAFDKSMLDNFIKINEDIQNTVTKLNSQKSLLEEQKTSALNAFDLAYAVKLSQKIDDINAKLLQQEQEVIKYNNQIAEKEAEYNASKKQEALDYAEMISKYGTGAIEQIKSNEKYILAKDYFMTIPKEDALNELKNNSVYKSELGNYYNTLYTQILARA